jgi:hypothetical protein
MHAFRTIASVVIASVLALHAKETNHWSFQSLQRPAVPKVETAFVRNPVDSFICDRLRKAGLKPSPEADRRTLIRRLYLDVLGLPPLWDEVQAFTNDPSPVAYERLVERVLASPYYGERWARHWLDVVRFAETHGFETNTPRDNAWPYRDYVIRAFNEDKPYTQFILEQLVGDAFGEDAATGFIVAGPWDEVKSPDVVLTANQRADELHDMVATTGSAFLGLTIGCARCHDHKFDPIPQTDYYAIKACFAGVQHGQRTLRPRDYDERMEKAEALRRRITRIEGQLTAFEPLANRHAGAARRPPVHPRQNVDRFEPIEAKFLRFTVENTTGLEPCIDELEVYTVGENSRNIAFAKSGAKTTASSVYPNNPIHKLEHVNDGLYGNGHSWISSETSKGWVQIEFRDKAAIDKVVWGRDREEKYADRLAIRYRIEVALNTNDWKIVASSEDRQPYVAGQKFQPAYVTNAMTKQLVAERERCENELKALIAFPMIYAGNFVKPEATYRLQRGDPMQKQEEVVPGVLSIVGPRAACVPTSEQERRLALARWIADESNPLTARVMVNRIWHYHFGQGIVNTPSDFGLKGSRPTHPELLDWLASEFIAQGWRPKAIHRLILLSHTYRQAGTPREGGAAADAGNALLWRFAPRRLEAEAIRDSILSVSGALDLRMGGPGYHVFERNDNYVRVYNPKQEFGPAEWRRMIYQYKPRMQQDSTFGAFDCPDGGQIAPNRGRSTTALQSLNLMNSAFMVQQSEIFAHRLQSSDVRRAFELAFSREPTQGEVDAALSLIREHGLTALCRALFSANEFLYLF